MAVIIPQNQPWLHLQLDWSSVHLISQICLLSTTPGLAKHELLNIQKNLTKVVKCLIPLC